VETRRLAAGVAGALLWSVAAAATPEPGGPTRSACAVALAERVRKERPRAEKVEMLSETLREWPESSVQTGLRGDGRFLQGNEWVAIEFRCVFNVKSAKVDHLADQAKAPGKPPLRGRTNADAFAAAACSREIERKLASDRPGTRLAVQDDSFEEWQISDTEAGVSGQGQAQGADRHYRPVRFECAYDARANRVTRADLQ